MRNLLSLIYHPSMGAKSLLEISIRLGISILPEFILQRILYDIIAKEPEVPSVRNIGIVMREKKALSLAVKRFLEYLQYRLLSTTVGRGT